jgi:hypothetical protein
VTVAAASIAIAHLGIGSRLASSSKARVESSCSDEWAACLFSSRRGRKKSIGQNRIRTRVPVRHTRHGPGYDGQGRCHVQGLAKTRREKMATTSFPPGRRSASPKHCAAGPHIT